MNWKMLGAVPPTDLVDARLQLHHAAQVVASAAVTHLDPQPDDSHPNLGWVESLGALVGRSLPGGGAQVGLRVADLTLLMVDASVQVNDELDLDGQTLDDAYTWLGTAMARAGAAMAPASLVRTNYPIPGHAVAKGAPFSSAPGQPFAELARWFANGHHALADLAAGMPGSPDVRCWPHHFDLGGLAIVATQPDGGLAKSIGFGLSPGDGDYPEPYWYVSPWPYPDPSRLPRLEAGGHWHSQGYTSAIMTGTDLLSDRPEGQPDRLQTFLDRAVDASRRALAD